MAIEATHIGFLLYPDVADIKDYDREYIQTNYTERIVISAKIFKVESSPYSRLICDLQNTDDDWGGVFKCWLYDDGKILGTFDYLKEANLPSEKIDGIYKLDNKLFWSIGLLYEGGEPFSGFYIDLMKI